jgi:hypothetical protein
MAGSRIYSSFLACMQIGCLCELRRILVDYALLTNYILFAIEVVWMYWKFINLRIIIELCGFVVVFWLVELQPVLNLATLVPRHLPRGRHVTSHLAATSSATWQPRHLPRGSHVICHPAVIATSASMSAANSSLRVTWQVNPWRSISS